MAGEAFRNHSTSSLTHVEAELSALGGFLQEFPSMDPDTQVEMLSEVDEWSDSAAFQQNRKLQLGVKGALLGVRTDVLAVETYYEDILRPMLDDSSAETRAALNVLDGIILYHTDLLALRSGDIQTHLRALSGHGIMETWFRNINRVNGLVEKPKKEARCVLSGFALGVALPEYRYKRMTDLELEITR